MKRGVSGLVVMGVWGVCLAVGVGVGVGMGMGTGGVARVVVVLVMSAAGLVRSMEQVAGVWSQERS